MKVQTKVKKFNLEANTLRAQISHRGGGIEISLDKLGRDYRGQKMTAYQNYLGGGMLGRIANDCTLADWQEDELLVAVAEKLSRYFHALSNEETENYDEWAAADFEAIQKRSLSAY